MADPDSKIQGEGDHESARRFNEKSRKFVETHDVDKLGHDAEPDSDEEEIGMEDAEEEGKSRAKE
jgi:hypothetical protein